ncbi:4164_t:CDS:2 [Acaulospora morrowiae]|uniref:4164_t:CDS:1 n=1 Tax=Acaulospora morrowiae TaxID=94023 RepID=A0A9N9FE95_9GLOM|nr:4164_t:CDS:2 [Acaulospora morrowiae]
MPKKTPTANKTIIRFFFIEEKKDDKETGYWKCKYCTDDEGVSIVTIKKEKGTGWSNTFSHISSKHKDYQEIIKKNVKNVFALTPAVKNILSWIKFIIHLNLPLSFVDDPLVHEMFKYDPIFSNTLKKHMKILTEKVEQNLKKELPNTFGLLLNGWKEGSDYYIALFACYYDRKKGCQLPLLAFQPIPDYYEDTIKEYTLTAEAHKQFIISVLKYYKVALQLDCLLFLVGDNCNTNKALAKLLNISLIGCASHKLNLAVKRFLEEYNTLLENINKLMIKLSTIKQVAKLHCSCDLQPIKRDETRWSSTFAMISRFFELVSYLNEEDKELFKFIPSRSEQNSLKKLLEKLTDFESVSRKIQEDSIDLFTVCCLFDALIDKYPIVEEYLSEHVLIVCNPSFESEICKVITGNENLTVKETTAMKCLKIKTDEIGEQESFVERVLKRPRLSKYPDLKFIPPTSNLVERFFSQANCFWNGRLLQSVYDEIESK